MKNYKVPPAVVGRRYEKQVIKCLTLFGLKIEATNIFLGERNRNRCEIDAIGTFGNKRVFVEIKRRNNWGNVYRVRPSRGDVGTPAPIFEELLSKFEMALKNGAGEIWLIVNKSLPFESKNLFKEYPLRVIELG